MYFYVIAIRPKIENELSSYDENPTVVKQKLVLHFWPYCYHIKYILMPCCWSISSQSLTMITNKEGRQHLSMKTNCS